MGGGRSRTFPKDLELLDRLKHENKKLKKEITRLRKELSKVDRYEDLQDLVEQQYEEDNKVHGFTKEVSREDLLKQWGCFECKAGYMKLIILSRMDGVFYFRRCSACAHKTRLKKYTEKVQGIKD